jgi:hypothetical protein
MPAFILKMVLVAAANYFESDTTDRLKPYSILVSGLIARPKSIKLLKAHTQYAAKIGFDSEANESLEKTAANFYQSAHSIGL